MRRILAATAALVLLAVAGSVIAASASAHHRCGHKGSTCVPPAPVASYTFAPASAEVGQAVNFDASGSSCAASPCSYRWADGATQIGTGMTLSHAFSAAGDHEVTLTITDSQWRSASTTRRFTVSEPSPSPSFGAVRPYDLLSPWNTPIGANPTLNAQSSSYIAAIADNGKPLTSDPDQYAIPVYHFDEQTPRVTMKLSGYFSSYDNGDNSRVGYGFAPTISDVPVPPDAEQSAGSDGQIVFWDPTSGTEYAFWQFYKDSSGVYRATNGYRYHTTSGYYGRFADGLAGRGAGLPYSGGLVRRWEIDQGRIEHALAFAYDSPSSQFVYPASKSDGVGVTGIDLPEGTRLQLDPGKTDADFEAWGLSPAAKVIARALQTYGMYVVDNSGSSKIFLEDRKTAGWEPSIDRNLVSGIPWSAFRVVEAPRPPA